VVHTEYMVVIDADMVLSLKIVAEAVGGNPYPLGGWSTPLPALAIGLSGLLGGMAVRTAAGRPVSPIAFAAATGVKDHPGYTGARNCGSVYGNAAPGATS
jgi:hypothetical protein